MLIGGGDKSGQSKDIEDARQLWKAFEDGGHAEAALRVWEAGRTVAPPSAEDVPPEAQDPRADGEEGTT